MLNFRHSETRYSDHSLSTTKTFFAKNGAVSPMRNMDFVYEAKLVQKQTIIIIAIITRFTFKGC